MRAGVAPIGVGGGATVWWGGATVWSINVGVAPIGVGVAPIGVGVAPIARALQFRLPCIAQNDAHHTRRTGHNRRTIDLPRALAR